MQLCEPLKDVWPYVQRIEGLFCYQNLYDGNDGPIIVGDMHFYIERRTSPLLQHFWFVQPWSDVGTHIHVRDNYGVSILHFVVTKIHIRSGVILTDKHDIACFFDPDHNIMLVNERKRASKKKNGSEEQEK